MLPASAEGESKLAPNNILRSAKYAAPFQRFSVHFMVDPHSIRFEPSPDGSLHAAVDFVEYVYTPAGEPVLSLVRNVNVSVSPAQYEQIMKANIPVNTVISVPAAPKAALDLRLLIHDRLSNHLGTLELPVAVIRKLPVQQ